MTNPPERRAPRAWRTIRTVVLAAACAALLPLVSCGESQPQQNAPPPPPPRPSAPPPPAATLRGLELHPKVQFPEERLPSTQEATNAVARFASALAAGDQAAFGAMLAPRDRALLDMLASEGEWGRTTAALRVVRICTINEPSGGAINVGFGIEDADGAFLSAWEGVEGTGGWVFTALAIEPVFGLKASDLDGAAMNPVGMPAAREQPAETPAAPPPPPPSEDRPPPPSGDEGSPTGLPRPPDF